MPSIASIVGISKDKGYRRDFRRGVYSIEHLLKSVLV